MQTPQAVRTQNMRRHECGRGSTDPMVRAAVTLPTATSGENSEQAEIPTWSSTTVRTGRRPESCWPHRTECGVLTTRRSASGRSHGSRTRRAAGRTRPDWRWCTASQYARVNTRPGGRLTPPPKPSRSTAASAGRVTRTVSATARSSGRSSSATRPSAIITRSTRCACGSDSRTTPPTTSVPAAT